MEIKITLKNLESLLDQQKELTGEAICKACNLILVDGKVDTSVIRNNCREARYPDDIYTLYKYIKR